MKKFSLSDLSGRIFGYYHVCTGKDECVRFVNALNAGHVRFRHAHFEGELFCADISIFRFDAAVKCARGADVSMNIRNTVGLSFLTYRYRHRPGLIAGALLAMAIVYISIFYVWEIRITGNLAIPESRIRSVLAANGLGEGSFIPQMSVRSIAAKTVLSLPDLSSVSVVINGTYADVDVIERERPPEILPKYDGISDICASKDGIVVKVEATSGKPLVKAGDVVTEGQVLVTGVYPGFNGTQIAVRSQGRVLADTVKKFVVAIPYVREYKYYTGRTDVKTQLSVLGREYDLFFGVLVPFVHYDAETSSERIMLFGSVKTPIIKNTLITREYEKSVTEITPEEALEKAQAAFMTWVKGLESGDVSVKTYDFEWVSDEISGCLVLTGEAVVTEDIGTETNVSFIS